MEWVYSNYKEEFMGFSFKYGLSSDEALDVYQDTVVAMYQNFVGKKVELTSSSLKTYLFGIGKFKLFSVLKTRNKHLPFLENVSKEEMVELEELPKNGLK